MITLTKKKRKEGKNEIFDLSFNTENMKLTFFDNVTFKKKYFG